MSTTVAAAEPPAKRSRTSRDEGEPEPEPGDQENGSIVVIPEDDQPPAGYAYHYIFTGRMLQPYKVVLVRQRRYKKYSNPDDVYKFIPRDDPYWSEDSQHELECTCYCCEAIREPLDDLDDAR